MILSAITNFLSPLLNPAAHFGYDPLAKPLTSYQADLMEAQRQMDEAKKLRSKYIAQLIRDFFTFK